MDKVHKPSKSQICINMKKKKKVIVKQRKAPRQTDRLTVGRNITWIWSWMIALQITDLASRQIGRPTWKRKKVIATQRNVKSGHLLQRGTDTKMNWPTDRRSQYNMNLSRCQLWGELQTLQSWKRGGISRWREYCESLWLWDGNSLITHEEECPPLEAGTRELVWDSRPRVQSVWYSNCSLWEVKTGYVK
jgi:hypothetical protein